MAANTISVAATPVASCIAVPIDASPAAALPCRCPASGRCTAIIATFITATSTQLRTVSNRHTSYAQYRHAAAITAVHGVGELACRTAELTASAAPVPRTTGLHRLSAAPSIHK